MKKHLVGFLVPSIFVISLLISSYDNITIDIEGKGISNIIKNKESVNRNKDLEDLKFLSKLNKGK